MSGALARREPLPAAWSAAWDETEMYSERLALVDLLDRVLGGGVVVAGDITLSIAGVDLVVISLRALVASVRALAASVAAE
jgi:Gas vesicle protein